MIQRAETELFVRFVTKEICSPAAFCIISAKFGKYDLIDSIVKYSPLTMRNHNHRRRFMQHLGEKSIVQTTNRFFQATYESAARIGKPILIPDLAFGRSI